MPIETVNGIWDFDPTWPLATDNVSEGDDHIRNIKLGTQQSFPNVLQPVTATQDQLNSSGVISSIYNPGGPYTHTFDARTRIAEVIMLGGGGGGSNSASGSGAGVNGGAAGGYVYGVMDIDDTNKDATINVGAGGAHSAAAGTAGDGADTTLVYEAYNMSAGGGAGGGVGGGSANIKNGGLASGGLLNIRGGDALLQSTSGISTVHFVMGTQSFFGGAVRDAVQTAPGSGGHSSINAATYNFDGGPGIVIIREHL